ncbi:tyrosine--tRNA ligase, mitochondrial isoform X2 [Lycorma delicatula]
MNLLHWQRAGHRVIALVGGATGQIGDPSGKTRDREPQSFYVVQENCAGIEKNIYRIFENHNKYFWDNKSKKEFLNPALIVNNVEWYKSMSALEFVTEIGRHFRMGQMMMKDCVHSRLNSEAGMNYTEFSYQIFQAFDWFNLLKNYDCRFQVGGSDQLGNISSGHEFISRVTKTEVYGLTLPLITTEQGNKYGKTEGNAIWLDPEKTSPFELYQFLIRTRDADIEKLLKFFTFYSVEFIDDICRKHKMKPELRLPQQKLAEQVTLLVHGEEGLKSAQIATKAMYDSSLEHLSQLSHKDVAAIFKGAETKELLLQPGLNVLEFALSAGCFKTEQDAKRIISAGGFSINQKKVTNIDEVLSDAVHILPNKISLARVGKRNYWVVKWHT